MVVVGQRLLLGHGRGSGDGLDAVRALVRRRRADHRPGAVAAVVAGGGGVRLLVRVRCDSLGIAKDISTLPRARAVA